MELATSMNVLFDPPKVSVEQALERLAPAGFKVLCFNFCDWLFDGSPFIDDDWEAWVMGIGDRADELGIRFCDAHGPIFPKFEATDKNAWLTAMSHRSIEAAGILGAPWVVFEPETLPGPFDGDHLAEIKQRNLDWFGALLPTAERASVGLALENIVDLHARGSGSGRAYCSVPAELIDLIDTFDRHDVGICWDTGHAHIQRLDQGRALRAVGRRLKTTHIADNHGDQDEHLLPFYGTVDWPAVMGALRAIEYHGEFSYEVHNSIRILPDELRDDALRFAAQMGKHLLAL